MINFLFPVYQSQIPSIIEACHVIISFILNRITSSSNADTKQYLYTIKSLCEGKSQMPNFDQNIIHSMLKNAKQPEHAKTCIGSDKESPKSELKRSRSDLSSVILQQLSTPLGKSGIIWPPLNEEISDCTVCIKYLIQIILNLIKMYFLFFFFFNSYYSQMLMLIICNQITLERFY